MISPWVFIAIGVLLLIIAAIAFFADDKTWNRIVALVTLIFGSGIFLFGAARAGMFGVGIQNRV
jgi:multidrug transporter EmrE-like cation transporter